MHRHISTSLALKYLEDLEGENNISAHLSLNMMPGNNLLKKDERIRPRVNVRAGDCKSNAKMITDMFIKCALCLLGCLVACFLGCLLVSVLAAFSDTFLSVGYPLQGHFIAWDV